MKASRFQISVATGRMTLPVAIPIGLLLWFANLDSWQDLGTLAATMLTGYLMIEFNTAFSLIRTRTTLQVVWYWLIVSGLLFLHPFQWNCWVPVVFLLAVFYFFRSYESLHTSANLFNVSFFITAGSLLFPKLIYFLPLFLISSIGLRSLNIKSFFGFLLGWIAPYWILFGYAFLYNRMELFDTLLKESIIFYTTDYATIPNHILISWLAICFLLLVCSIHFGKVSYQDKTRTRVYLTFLVATGWWTVLLIALQPQTMYPLMFIQLICTSFLAAHLFTLTRNRFSGIGFIVTIISIIALTCYNLWM